MALSLENLVAWSVQIGCVSVVAAAVAALLRVSGGVCYGYWRAVVALCLALPLLQSARTPAADSTSVTATIANVAGLGPEAYADAATAATSVDWRTLLLVILCAGVVARVAWLTVGLLKLRRLSRAGDPLRSADCSEIQALFRTRAAVRYAPHVRQPVTFGLRRPVVLLPDALRDQPAAIREAVLAHELTHVARSDWAWVLGEEFVRAIFWFHPAMWWLVSRIQLAREEVVDATAVAVTGRRRDYIEALLAFADAVPLAPAPAFARRRHLFRRILLISTEDVMSARRIVVSACVMTLAVAASTAYAVGAFPLHVANRASLQSGPGPLEQAAKPVTPENPIPRRVHVVAPSPQTIPEAEGAVVTLTVRGVIDTGGSVAEARTMEFSVRTAGFQASFSPGPSGKTAEFEKFLDESRARRPGQPSVPPETFKLLYDTFTTAAVDAVRQWRYEAPHEAPIAFDMSFTFSGGRVATRTGNTAALRSSNTTVSASGVDNAIRVGGAVKPPVKVKDVRPIYPQEAKEQRVQGVVIAELRVGEDGRVTDAKVLRSVHLLDQAALDAATQWEFMPTLLNGAPVPVIMTVTIQFSLAQ